MPVTDADIQVVANAIAKRFNPDGIVLFGSRARGDARADSDVDLLVIMDFEGSPIRKAVELLQGIETPFALDLVVRAPGDVRRRYEQGDPIIRDAIDRGRTLFGRAA
ncbi:MAG: nucleotidyltransferase domain-containing protein [Phycisphaerae bacterium]|nr:nucleotidyltransferase domain-containing protein [Phycisphaerae bacterium]